MSTGTFYAVGVGPGDAELLTLKAVRVIGQAGRIYVPFAVATTQSWVADAVAEYAKPEAQVCDVSFSMGRSREERQQHWKETAADIITALKQGLDCAFVTLGDPLLYSTAIYLLRELRQQWPEVNVEVVPGINAYTHCAALTEFALGEGNEPLTILPTISGMGDLEAALTKGGTLVLMKIGKRLQAIIDLLEDKGLIDQAVFVARAGLPNQRIETDLRNLRGADDKAGNLAIILVHA